MNMATEKEWKKHMAAILIAVEKSTEPGVMSKKEALGFMDLLVSEIESRQEALAKEIGEQDDEPDEGDEELFESADEYLES
jgi:hypothetical protein